MAKKAELLTISYDAVDVVTTTDVAAGDVAKFEDVHGFFLVNVKTGDDAALVAKASKVKVEKASNQTWKTGEAVYWDNRGKKFSTTSAGNTLVGYTTKSSPQAETHGFISFDGFAALLKA